MSDLAEFLLARIAEDEAQARQELADGYGDRTDGGWTAIRVLAECEAKRRIVTLEAGSRTLHDMVGDISVSFSDEGSFVHVNGERMTTEKFNAVFTEPSQPSMTLKLLALPYADHPDYQDQWRP